MLFIHRDEQYLDFRGMLRQFMNEGRGEHVANLETSHFIYPRYFQMFASNNFWKSAADMETEIMCWAARITRGPFIQ